MGGTVMSGLQNMTAAVLQEGEHERKRIRGGGYMWEVTTANMEGRQHVVAALVQFY